MAALEERLVRGRIDRAAAGQARFLLRRQLNLNLVGDGARDVALQRQDIPQVALVLLGPQVRIRRRVNQLGGDSDASLRPQDRAFDDGIDVERLRDLGQWLSSALVAHDRRARDHTQRAYLGERGDQRVGHAIGKKVIVRPGERFSSGSTASERTRACDDVRRAGRLTGVERLRDIERFERGVDLTAVLVSLTRVAAQTAEHDFLQSGGHSCWQRPQGLREDR